MPRWANANVTVLRAVAWLTALWVLGCATAQNTPVDGRQPADPATAGSEHNRARLIRLTLNRLRDGLDTISQTPSDAFEQRLPEVLRAVADALELVPKQPPTFAAGQVREAAKKIESSSSSLDHAAATKDALAKVLQALVRVTPPTAVLVEYQAHLAKLGNASQDVAINRPILEQRPTVLRALHRAVDALSLLGGESVRRVRRQTQAGEAGLAEIVDEAHALVLELAKASSGEMGAIAGRILSRFADAVQSIPVSGDEDVSDHLADVRFQSQRLRTSSSVTLGQARWIKRGLGATLQGFQRTRLADCAAINPWLHTAQLSTQAIEERTAMVFQRAVIQDALRTVSNVFLVASDSSHCSKSPGR